VARIAKVIKIDDRKNRIDKSMIQEYFTRFNDIRNALKESLKKKTKNTRRFHKKKSGYERSAFYIGKSITRLSFYGLNAHRYEMETVVTDLQSRCDLTGTSTFAQGRDLHIYLRKENKEK
jgi:hypothetical protein